MITPIAECEKLSTQRTSAASATSAVRVYILDDHEVAREGIKVMLEASQRVEVVGESDSVWKAVGDIPRLHPDVSILDARLPDGSGIEVCRAIRSVDPSLHALILTSYDDDEALLSAILAGASGYVLKDVRGHDLVNLVERVAAGESLIDPALTRRVVDRLHDHYHHAPELAGLTAQQLAVLELLAEGLTNHQISQRMQLADKTVKNYVSALLHTLGLERRTQAAVLAARVLDTAQQR